MWEKTKQYKQTGKQIQANTKKIQKQFIETLSQTKVKIFSMDIR